jgi:hypothetical protein
MLIRQWGEHVSIHFSKFDSIFLPDVKLHYVAPRESFRSNGILITWMLYTDIVRGTWSDVSEVAPSLNHVLVQNKPWPNTIGACFKLPVLGFFLSCAYCYHGCINHCFKLSLAHLRVAQVWTLGDALMTHFKFTGKLLSIWSALHPWFRYRTSPVPASLAGISSLCLFDFPGPYKISALVS